MSAAIRIMRTEHTAEELRMMAANDSNVARVRRLLALSLILEGQRREKAARQGGMDRQILRVGPDCLNSFLRTISGFLPGSLRNAVFAAA